MGFVKSLEVLSPRQTKQNLCLMRLYTYISISKPKFVKGNMQVVW